MLNISIPTRITTVHVIWLKTNAIIPKKITNIEKIPSRLLKKTLAIYRDIMASGECLALSMRQSILEIFYSEMYTSARKEDYGD